MKSLNVLFVSHVFPPYFGGGQPQVARDYAKGLSSQGNNIMVITHHFPGLKEKEKLDGIEIVRFPSISKFLFKIGLFRPKGLKKRLKDNIKKYDIIYIHGIYTLYEYIVAKACKKYNIPYVVMPHGVGNISKQKEKVLLKRIFVILFSNYVSQNADKIIFCSDNEKQDYEILYKEGVVINNGINQDFWNMELQNLTKMDIDDFRKRYNLGNRKIILSMGRLAYGKRFDKVIDYLSNFLKNNVEYLLVIVGPDGGEFNNLNNQIIENGLEKNVKIIQGLYDKDKFIIFKISDLFILASDHEGFPIVVCEAISSRIPCLISNECNISGCKGFVEIFSNEIEFKEKLKILLNNKTINKDYVSSFNIINSISKLSEVISKTLSGGC